MKNPIAWKPSLNGILLLDSQLMPTIFDISIKMEVLSDDFNEQEIALNRIQTIVETIFGASIICEMDEIVVDFPYTFSNNIVAIPGAPSDQILCGLTYTKLNAVADGKIRVVSVQLTSTRGNGIEYCFDAQTPVPVFLQPSDGFLAWWLRDDISTTDSFEIDKNVIHFPLEYPSWEDLELSWDQKSDIMSDNTEDTGTVINFNSIKHDN